eukprot:CAMPEP_0184302078 /NCGR_PEP_ID=MMETSP1049-20130417/12140_1 /TAXON_ID=77928 /ORGANISM="Proteomonas sulcata, Strain CCMP704" /LENGTH=148 /DNA_ID=CAMNT_0026613261 /DNA_START=273 /DNA_END=720 /DNA_ORIENTATION=-
MAESEAIKPVDIDDNGTFKYILIRVTGGASTFFVVRGFGWVNPIPSSSAPSSRQLVDLKPQASQIDQPVRQQAEYHDDIYQEVSARIEAQGLETECVGGGRIQRVAATKSLKVYGYSQAFGRADHQKSVDLLQKDFPDYEITWSNDGY